MVTPDDNASSRVRILTVEDHDALREVIVETLAGVGFQVTGVACAEEVDELPAGQVFDIAILDLNLPGRDGLTLAGHLRDIQPRIGIIMVTARGELEDRLVGYARGADVYLTKPVTVKELLATVEALARRLSPPPSDHRTFVLRPGRLELDTPAGVLTLTATEARILHAMTRAPDRRLETWQMLECLGLEPDAMNKTRLEVVLSRLRAKLFSHGAPENPVRSERNRGYRLCMQLLVE